MTRRRTWIALCTGVLLLFWLSRLHHLLTLPLFMDEATHLTRAQAVWQGKPFELLLTGKALGPYLAAAFYPFFGAPWLGRFVIVLVGSIGIAAVMALGRALHSRQVGLLSGVLWLLCPYLFFFERLALVDATVASLAMLSAWLAVRMLRSGKWPDAVLCGLGLAACAFAKTTGIVFFVIPLGVGILITTRCTWPRRLRQVMLAYLVAAAILLIPAMYIASQSANVFGIGTLASSETQSLGERLSTNQAAAFNAFQSYFTPVFLAIILFGAVVGLGMHPRRGLILLMLISVPLSILLLTATTLYLRYLVIAVPGLLILAASGLVTFASINRRLRALPWLMVGGWALLYALPFFATAFREPPMLPLPEGDRYEYLSGWTSGYGLREVAEDLIRRAQDQPLTAIGMLGSCNTIRLYVPQMSHVNIECPDVWQGTRGIWQARLAVSREVFINGSALVIGENDGPLSEDAIPTPNERLQFYERPGGDYSVILFNILRR